MIKHSSQLAYQYNELSKYLETLEYLHCHPFRKV